MGAIGEPRLATLLGWLILVGCLIGLHRPAEAGITASQLEQVAAAPQIGIQLPLQIQLTDLAGHSAPLRSWLGGVPTVWLLADYTCETLCGPAISIVSRTMADTGLRAGDDFRLIVVGFDPKDSVAQALAMKDAQLSTRGGLPEHSFFLRATAADIDLLTDRFGVRLAYDRDRDQFAHPAAAFVVTADGRVSRALSALAVDARSLRLAVVEAGRGHVGGWTDQIHLLCYGFDPASGTYGLAVRRLVLVAASISVIVLGVLIGLLFRRDYVAR